METPMPRQKPVIFTLRPTLAQELAAAGYPVQQVPSLYDEKLASWKISEIDSAAMDLIAAHYDERGQDLPESLRKIRENLQRREGGSC